MDTMVYKCVQHLQTLLFPSVCRLCGAASGQVAGLCMPCLADAPWITTACPRCSRALPAAYDAQFCGRCQRHPPAFDATTVRQLTKCRRVAYLERLEWYLVGATTSYLST